MSSLLISNLHGVYISTLSNTFFLSQKKSKDQGSIVILWFRCTALLLAKTAHTLYIQYYTHTGEPLLTPCENAGWNALSMGLHSAWDRTHDHSVPLPLESMGFPQIEAPLQLPQRAPQHFPLTCNMKFNTPQRANENDDLCLFLLIHIYSMDIP